MTDTSPGPGWWLASDGKWSPPHLHPTARATATHPPDDPRPSVVNTPMASAGSAPETVSTIDWEAVGRERAALRAERHRREASRRRRGRFLVLGAVGMAAIVVTALLTRDDGSTSDVATTGTTTPLASGATAGATITTTRPPTTTSAVPTSGTLSVFSLQPGTCIDQDNLMTGLVTTVRVTSCTEPHSHEVFLRTTVTPVDAAYDAARVTEFANKACTDGFTDYVGVPYERSRYYYVHLAPSAESWNKSRDRDVVCLVLLEGEKLTSSVKGTGG